MMFLLFSVSSVPSLPTYYTVSIDKLKYNFGMGAIAAKKSVKIKLFEKGITDQGYRQRVVEQSN